MQDEITDSTARDLRFAALAALAQLTDRIARATRFEELYDAALTALADAIDARRASLLLYDAAGVMRFVAWRDLSDAYRAVAEGHSPWERDEPRPQVLTVSDATLDPSLASLQSAFNREGIRALAFIPLIARTGLIGKFMVYWPEPHELTPVEREAVSGIADRVALGIERLRMEEAVRTSRDHLEAILRGIADGVTAQDETGAIIFANPAAARLSGFASVPEFLEAGPEEIAGRFELFDEDGAPISFGELPGRYALRGETPPSKIVRFRDRVTGVERWSIVAASPVRDAAGQVNLAINIFRDVTQSQEIRQHERFLAAFGEVLASSLDYEVTLKAVARLAIPMLADWCRIDIVGDDGIPHTLAVEHPDTAMLVRAQEMMRRFPPAPERDAVLRVHATGRAELYPLITDEMLSSSGLEPEYLEFLREVGFRSVMVVPLQARGRVLAILTLVATSRSRSYTASDLAFAEDVARRAALAVDNALLFRHEQEARQGEASARAEAEAANRAKDEFLATLSHELRTPLTAILGWSRLLTGNRAEPKFLEDGLQAIARSAEAQARIVDDLLDVSRITSGKLRLEVRPVRLREVLAATLATVAPAAEARHVRLDSGAVADVAVLGDFDRLQQVFWNLLTNAVKFTPRGGSVEMRTVRAPDDSILVEVSDSGIGIAPEFLPHVFERFRQGDSGPTRQFGGLGLGLSIVKSLVELHGGTVAARSEGEGAGSTFAVTLPLAAAEETRGPARDAALSLEGRNVLLVEDEVETRTFLTALLETRGAAVRAVEDVASALGIIDEWMPHLVISDIALPGEDGHALVRTMRAAERWRAIPAIAVTAYGSAIDRERALAAGFDAFLRKPVDPETLVSVVAGLRRN
jgi:signal transduction histidine kinase/PAS domain-containing protein/ActR/RegA family two-component response regulator